jgi:hypothetical protein
LPKAGQTRAGLTAENLEDLGETGKKRPEGRHDKDHGKPRGDKSRNDRSRSDRPRGEKSHADKPRANKTNAEKLRAEKPEAPKLKSQAPKGDEAAMKTEKARERRRTRSGKPAAPIAE